MAGETVLVVGGAGYIGSHTCLDLANKGYKPVVFDNFSNGHREFVKWGPAEEGDIRDRARLDEVLAKHKPSAILHFAALIEVGESVKDPVAFYDNNVIGTLMLLIAFIPFVRYLILILFAGDDAGAHLQSLILGSAFLVGALLSYALGVLADLQRTNRTLIEESLERMKELQYGLGSAERPASSPRS